MAGKLVAFACWLLLAFALPKCCEHRTTSLLSLKRRMGDMTLANVLDASSGKSLHGVIFLLVYYAGPAPARPCDRSLMPQQHATDEAMNCQQLKPDPCAYKAA